MRENIIVVDRYQLKVFAISRIFLIDNPFVILDHVLDVGFLIAIEMIEI